MTLLLCFVCAGGFVGCFAAGGPWWVKVLFGVGTVFFFLADPEVDD